MPGTAVVEEKTRKRSNNKAVFSKSFNHINNLVGESPEGSQEFFWGCELSKEKPEHTWKFTVDEDEDDGETMDLDFMEHTLFLKHAILGAGATKGETNIVEVQTKNFQANDISQPILSLNKGTSDMCALDLSFSHKVPVTFKLTSGSGPVFLNAQHLVEFPPDEESDEFDSEDEAEEEDEDEVEEDEEDIGDEEEDVEMEEKAKKSVKRKASNQKTANKAKKGKMEESVEESDEESDEDFEEEEEDEESEMSESSPEKVSRPKKKAKSAESKKKSVTPKQKNKGSAKKNKTKK